MSHEPSLPEAATPSYPAQSAARPVARKPAAGARKSKPRAKAADGLSRGALAGRIAAGAAIGSAAIAGALLFAGKIDGKTPKRLWDKVKPPGRAAKRSEPKKGDQADG
jgi:hypothetical protein